MTSSALFSSSGWAVAIMKMPVLPRWRRTRPSATCPRLSSSGATRICARGVDTPIAPAASSTITRRFIGPLKDHGPAKAGRYDRRTRKTATTYDSELQTEAELELARLVGLGHRELLGNR